ncbi:hypothetical protein V6N11_003314 [Hibiscus sabdariffa]|uniref:PRONE domain-containing protein n=1 Tax=Hibiscus sabdariffa TaxID=183260 RepID=A0ABR2SD51_9ROSI
MLISILDGFHDSEFYYADRGVVINNSDGIEAFPSSSPTKCRECTHQILKAAMAINNIVLAEMEIPNAYLKSLPKCGKDCLREITADQFSPECLLDYFDLLSEYTALEMANRVEASLHIWKHRYLKGTRCVQRWESQHGVARLRFPGLRQTSLDMSKIQQNKDVGQSILESYSRVMESLAFNITARIDDLLYVDDATKEHAMAAAESISVYETGRFDVGVPRQSRISTNPLSFQRSGMGTPCGMTADELSESSDRRIYQHINNGNLRDSLDGSLVRLAF